MFKTLALAALAVMTTNGYAGHLDTVCESATHAKPVFDSQYLAQRKSTGMTVIETLSGEAVVETWDSVRAIIRDTGSLWALTPTALVEVDMAGEVLGTHDIEAGLSMIQSGRKLIISRGAAGVMAFDMDEKKVLWTNFFGGDEDYGQPSGLATDGRVLYAMSATSFQNGFTGVVTMNPETGAIIRKTPYDTRSWGVLDTDVKARMHGENLVLNNGGWIHLITKKQLESEKAIKPRWVAHTIPAEDDVSAHYMMIAGDFLMHDGQVMACGVYTARGENGYVRKSKLFHVKLP